MSHTAVRPLSLVSPSLVGRCVPTPPQPSSLFFRRSSHRRPPNICPIFRLLRQTRSHRVLANVFFFGARTLFATQPVIEKIPLPPDMHRPRTELFPFRNHHAHLSLLGKQYQGVQMVRHQQEQLHPPIAASILMRNRLEYLSGDFRRTELIATTRPTTDRDKENRVVRTNKRRNAMWQLCSCRQRHARRIPRTTPEIEPKLPLVIPRRR